MYMKYRERRSPANGTKFRQLDPWAFDRCHHYALPCNLLVAIDSSTEELGRFGRGLVSLSRKPPDKYTGTAACCPICYFWIVQNDFSPGCNGDGQVWESIGGVLGSWKMCGVHTIRYKFCLHPRIGIENKRIKLSDGGWILIDISLMAWKLTLFILLDRLTKMQFAYMNNTLVRLGLRFR